MKPLSTRAHGLVDYASVLLLWLTPRRFVWGGGARRLLGRAAAATLAYSLLTRYEWGLFRLLPMPAHLWLDAVQAVMLCAAPVFLPREERVVRAAILSIGLGELAVVALSRPHPPPSIAA